MEAWRLTKSTGSGPKPLHSRLKWLDSTHPSGEGSAAIIVYFQHAAKTLSREMPFSQQQPVVAATCFTSRPPVFTKHCCKLVSDQLLTFRGSPSRRHRLPGGGSPGTGFHPRCSMAPSRISLRPLFQTATFKANPGFMQAAPTSPRRLMARTAIAPRRVAGSTRFMKRSISMQASCGARPSRMKSTMRTLVQ